MAGNREIVGLQCSECKSQNYVTTRNKVNMQQKGDVTKLELKKLCPKCGKMTLHKEKAKLK